MVGFALQGIAPGRRTVVGVAVGGFGDRLQEGCVRLAHAVGLAFADMLDQPLVKKAEPFLALASLAVFRVRRARQQAAERGQRLAQRRFAGRAVEPGAGGEQQFDRQQRTGAGGGQRQVHRQPLAVGGQSGAAGEGVEGVAETAAPDGAEVGGAQRRAVGVGVGEGRGDQPVARRLVDDHFDQRRGDPAAAQIGADFGRRRAAQCQPLADRRCAARPGGGQQAHAGPCGELGQRCEHHRPARRRQPFEAVEQQGQRPGGVGISVELAQRAEQRLFEDRQILAGQCRRACFEPRPGGGEARLVGELLAQAGRQFVRRAEVGDRVAGVDQPFFGEEQGTRRAGSGTPAGFSRRHFGQRHFGQCLAQ